MEKPTIKDKAVQAYVSHLESELEKFHKNPYVNSYLSIKMLIDKGNQTINSLTTSTEFDFESPKFKGIEKFLSNQKEYFDQMDYYRTKMTTSEIETIKTLIKEGGVEEYLKENGKL